MGKFSDRLIAFFFVSLLFWLLNPVEDNFYYRTISAQALQAQNQNEIRDFYNEFQVCNKCLIFALSSNGITIEDFRNNVQFSIVLDHPENGFFGVTLLFVTVLDYKQLEPAFDAFETDFLKQFKDELNQGSSNEAAI